MKEKRNEILQQLCECYEDLGEDLFLLTALLAYSEDPETDDTAEACFRRVRDYLEQHGKDVVHLSAALVRQPA